MKIDIRSKRNMRTPVNTQKWKRLLKVLFPEELLNSFIDEFHYTFNRCHVKIISQHRKEQRLLNLFYEIGIKSQLKYVNERIMKL